MYLQEINLTLMDLIRLNPWNIVIIPSLLALYAVAKIPLVAKLLGLYF